MGLRLSSRRKKVLVVATIIVLLARATIYVIHLANGPATGTVLKTVPVQSSTPVAYKTLSSKYFTTRYPTRYSIVNTGPSASLQSWTLVGHQATADQQLSKISIVITALPAGGVKEDSAYKLYSANPTLYKLSQGSYGNDPVIIAKRGDSGYQQTVLWPHGNYLLSISLTTSSETTLVNGELQTVLSHLRWLI